jgi:hypothetical protein
MAKVNEASSAEIKAFEDAERESLIREILKEQKSAKKAKTLQQAEQSRRALKTCYHNERKIRFAASPLYRNYFGDVMKIGINGFAVFVKMDGIPVMLPESFAIEGMRKLRLVDDYELKREKRADVHNNLESSPGELRIV